MCRYFFISILILTLGGCSTMRSGKYFQVGAGGCENLSKRYQVPLSHLRSLNGNKTCRVGGWVFVPFKVGFAHNLEKYFSDEPFDPNYLYHGRFIWPVPASTKISSYYGKRGRRNHEGIDIPAPRGTHIMAVEDGVVIHSGNKLSGYGNLTIIKHKGGIFSVYAHAKKNFTKRGQKVNKGEVIAQVGTSGRSTGPHLHFELRIKNKAINPLPYVKQSRSRFIASKKK